jgi:hypothetical protein
MSSRKRTKSQSSLTVDIQLMRDHSWWKAKLKDEPGSDGPVGLIPASYVEEVSKVLLDPANTQIPPINQTRAIYAYDSTSPEELSITEDSLLHVYSIEDDWLLVRLDSGSVQHLGFVPRTYCEPLDARAETEVTVDAAEVEAEQAEEREATENRQKEAERQRVLRAKDKVETWSISELEGKKKKKGTLGVGNGAVFFASDTDKVGLISERDQKTCCHANGQCDQMTPVKQYKITELSLVSQTSSKNIQLTFSSLSEPLTFHCGSSSNASAILAKLETSKVAAGEALEMAAATGAGSSDEEDVASEPKSVRWAAAPTPAASVLSATVLYDFDAQGEDELSVQENESVVIMDKENDEWWTVRNASGQEGVVPAQYVQLEDGTAPVQLAEEVHEGGGSRRAEEEAAAAASLDAESCAKKSDRASCEREGKTGGRG